MTINHPAALDPHVRSDSRFHPERLPSPLTYYSQHWRLPSPDSQGWVHVCCVFHGDEQSSLAINLQSGAFHCCVCKAEGADVVDFVMQFYKIEIETAAKILGGR